MVILAAFFLLRLATNPRWNSDAAIAVMSASALAVGIIVISRTSGMTTDVDNYMFGSVLAMTWADVALSAVLSLAVLALFVLFYHKLFAVTFDESFSQATGLRVDWYNTLLAILTALTIVLGDADDGVHADLLPGDLPGADGHAAVQELPGRGGMCRRYVGVLLLRGTHGLLDAVHAGGSLCGGGKSRAVSALLCCRLAAQALENRPDLRLCRISGGFFLYNIRKESGRKGLRFSSICAMMRMLEE